MARTTNKAESLLTFSRASSGTALTKVAYGPELVTNGTFDTDTSGWSTSSATMSVVAGELEVVPSVSTYGAYQNVTVQSNKTYEVTLDARAGTGSPWIRLGNTGILSSQYVFDTSATTGARKYIIVTTGTQLYISLGVTGTSTTSYFDNISVKEVFYNDPTGTLKLISHPTNKPRVEYDANGVAKGLLIEEQRTNLAIYSEDPTNSSWGKVNTASATQTVLSFPAVNDRIMAPWVSANTPGTYTASIGLSGSGTITVFMDAISPYEAGSSAVVTLSSSPQIVTLTSTFTVTGSPNTIRFNIRRDVNDTSTVTLTRGVQIEAASLPSSYIPTSGATATRSADIAQVSVSEFGYNQAQGTFVVDFQTPDLANANVVDLGITSNDRFLIRNGLAYYRTAAGPQVGINYSPSANNQRVAFAVQTNDAVAAVNGSIVGTDNTVTLFSDPTTLEIGALVNVSTNEKLNGHVKSIKYYPVRLDDDKLKELTL